MEEIRKFATGADRDKEEGKLDFEGFLNPLVLEAYAKYMDKHRTRKDGTLRESDNWQKGIPKDVYMKSAWRHFHDLWKEHRGYKSQEGIEDALMGCLFNIMGYAYEILKEGKIKEDKIFK